MIKKYIFYFLFVLSFLFGGFGIEKVSASTYDNGSSYCDEAIITVSDFYCSGGYNCANFINSVNGVYTYLSAGGNYGYFENVANGKGWGYGGGRWCMGGIMSSLFCTSGESFTSGWDDLSGGASLTDLSMTVTVDTSACSDGNTETSPSLFASVGALNEISTVTSDFFNSILPYIFIIAGVLLSFYIMQKIIGMIPKDDDKKYKEMVERGTAMRKEIEKIEKEEYNK